MGKSTPEIFFTNDLPEKFGPLRIPNVSLRLCQFMVNGYSVSLFLSPVTKIALFSGTKHAPKIALAIQIQTKKILPIQQKNNMLSEVFQPEFP